MSRSISARHSLALIVSLALALPVGMGMPTAAEASAWAGPARRAKAAEAAEDPALEEARQFYDEGKARFDTFDYEGAVEMWTKAYAKLPDDESGVRNAMVYNIATAQEKAYDLDKDLQHLRQAVLLLDTYIKNYKAIYQRTPETEAELAKAEGRIADLKDRIAQAERGEVAPQPTPPPAGSPDPNAPTNPNPRYGSGEYDGIVWNTGHTPPPDPELLAKNRRLAEADRKTDKMLIGSYVALSLGGLFTLSGVGTVAGTREAGAGAQGTGWGVLGLGVAGLTVGTVLIVVGTKRRRKAREGTLVRATPTFGRRFAGAAMQLNF